MFNFYIFRKVFLFVLNFVFFEVRIFMNFLVLFMVFILIKLVFFRSCIMKKKFIKIKNKKFLFCFIIFNVLVLL